MPEACQLAKIPKETGGPSRETERSGHVPAERQDRKTPGVAQPRGPRPIPSCRRPPDRRLGDHAGDPGFSCSRRSEYSYHCCPKDVDAQADGPPRRARCPALAHTQQHLELVASRAAAMPRGQATREQMLVVRRDPDPAAGSSSASRHATKERRTTSESWNAIARLHVDPLADPDTGPQVAQLRDIGQASASGTPAGRSRRSPEPSREARGRGPACRRRSSRPPCRSARRSRGRGHRARGPRAATGRGRGRPSARARSA